MIVDPTEEEGAVGGWGFDPHDGRHAGWERQFEAFRAEHHDKLLGYLTRLAAGFTQAELDPENVAQVVWARAALRWPTVQALDNPIGWVYRVGGNIVRRAYVRRKARREATTLHPGWTSTGQRARPVADQALGAIDGAIDDPIDDLLDELEPGPAMAALQDLPGHQRAATYLAEVEGWSAREIAGAVGCPESAVYTHTARGRAKLRHAASSALGWATVASAASMGSLLVGVLVQGLLMLLAELSARDLALLVATATWVVVMHKVAIKRRGERDRPKARRSRK
ncbi:RNA polymerase sigma factor [Catellatospora sp. NPDC049133]|uniref:RNA polymerase sigma factor n=1 Tax=Catellatospora sp. NPDC049133 TaxID=3155499 RepID=UPI0033CCFB8E